MTHTEPKSRETHIGVLLLGGVLASGLLVTMCVRREAEVWDKHTLLRHGDCLSPTRRYVASSFTVMGGGAAGTVMDRVSVRRAGAPLDPLNYVFSMGKSSTVRLLWNDDRQLTVLYPSSALRGEESVRQVVFEGGDTVQVRYEERNFRDSIPGCPLGAPVRRSEVLLPCGMHRSADSICKARSAKRGR